MLKVTENRLRRIAERRGYSLEKSRRRDPKAPDFGRFRLVDVKEKRTVFGGEPFLFSASLEEVERWLDDKPDDGTIGAEVIQTLKKLEALERYIGRTEDELGIARSSRSDPWEVRIQRVSEATARRREANALEPAEPSTRSVH